ncbi:MAG TPA: two-component regulator propeller domain-containing protein [Segetibacter sp.]
MIRTFLLFLFFCSCAITSKSQPVNYRFTHIGTSEGVSNNVINDIKQDSKGFIWIATGNGLQRYDGYRFLSFHFEFGNNKSLPSDNVQKILEDEKGNVWAACNTGVARINQFRQQPQRVGFDQEVDDLQMEVTQFFRDSKNNIWLLARPYGAFRFDAKTQKFIAAGKFLPPFNWHIYYAAEEPATGNFWLGCDSGLAYYDVMQHEIYNYANNPLKLPLLQDPQFFHRSVTGLMIDADNQMWLNTFWSGYPNATDVHYKNYRYSFKNKTLGSYTAPARYNHMYATDRHNNIWLLGEGMFSENQGNNFVRIASAENDPYGLKAKLVFCLFEDQQHNYWIGTEDGIYVFSREKETIKRGSAFDEVGKSVETEVNHFLELPNGRIWMATWGQGIYEYTSDFRPVKNYLFTNGDKSYNLVWSMHLAKDGKVWIGCQEGRLMIYDPSTGKFDKLMPKAFDLRTIRTITEDQQSNIWFGTQHGLIIKYNAATRQFIRFAEPAYPAKQLYGNIHQLLVDRHNFLWACTGGAGLLKMNVENGKIIDRFKHNVNNPSSLLGADAMGIVEYNDTLMAVASSGLNILNTKTKKAQHITTQDGLPSNDIKSLQKDQAGNLWAGVSGAIVKVRLPSNKIELYGKEDGVLNDAFEVNAMQLLKDGRLVAGTSKDFIYFDPTKLQSDQFPPDVKITGLRIFQSDINIDSVLQFEDKLRLSYNQSFVTIEFSSLTYLNDKFTYYYKLQGLDKDWIKATKELTASYKYLSGGNYTFLVKCENGEGQTSKNISSLKIYIRPPFWETWWFYFLLAVATAGVLYFFHRLRLNRLVEMQMVRTRIARDLHDDMGSTLSTINILSEMAKMKIDKDLNVTKDYIGKISDNSSRMMEAMDDIVWSINPINDSMEKITARMREYAANLFEAKDIEYTFNVDESVKHIKLDMEARRDFFLIFKEAINNLVRHSKCKHAAVKIEIYEYTMLMKILDDGVGFVVKEVDNGNGISNMQKRAQALNGILNIESKVSAGTKVILEVKFA